MRACVWEAEHAAAAAASPRDGGDGDSDGGVQGGVAGGDGGGLEVVACSLCRKAFGLLCWLHHCRLCGRAVCSECWSTTLLNLDLEHD